MSGRRTARIIGTVVKLMAVLLIFSVCGVLIFRMCSSGDPESMSVLTPNETLAAAYAENDGELTLRYQYQSTITRGENNAGYFSVTQYVFIPEAKQVQLVFRYNNSTLQHLAIDYGLPEIPAKEGTYFDVTLVRTTDLTPENREDNIDPATLGKKRYAPSEVYTTRDTSPLYTYYRYVFENVEIEDLTLGVFADVYYVGDLDYEKEAYGRLCLYDDESKWVYQKLSNRDRAALGTFRGE